MRPHLLAAAALLSALAAPAQTVTPVPKLDLRQYVGQWYEIQRIPTKREKNCAGDAFVLDALAEKPRRFQMVDSCRSKQGFSDVINKDGEQSKQGDGKLKVNGLLPFFLFASKRWVLALGSNYEWALVGSPNHKSLWIFSRTATLPPEVLIDIRARAAAQGFDPAKLVVTTQSR